MLILAYFCYRRYKKRKAAENESPVREETPDSVPNISHLFTAEEEEVIEVTVDNGDPSMVSEPAYNHTYTHTHTHSNTTTDGDGNKQLKRYFKKMNFSKPDYRFKTMI